VLNPETNSDSDSLKSKGARWVSASVQINHTGKKNKNKTEDWETKERIEYENMRIITITRRVLNTASYEIDWATERSVRQRMLEINLQEETDDTQTYLHGEELSFV